MANELTTGRFPQHYAAASLKQSALLSNERRKVGFPQHYAAASLKLGRQAHNMAREHPFSAALRCGLIEA